MASFSKAHTQLSHCLGGTSTWPHLGIQPGQQTGRLGRLLNHSGVFNHHGTETWLSKHPPDSQRGLWWSCVLLKVNWRFWQNFILRQSNSRASTLGVKTFSVKRELHITISYETPLVLPNSPDFHQVFYWTFHLHLEACQNISLWHLLHDSNLF